MRQLTSSSLSNQNLATALLAHTYTADSDRAIFFRVFLDQIAGNGDYTVYLTVQRLGVGSAYKSQVTTEAVASGVTAVCFSTIPIPVKNTDVVKVYVLGLAGDTTTPDIVTEVWDDCLPSAAPGAVSGLPVLDANGNVPANAARIGNTTQTGLDLAANWTAARAVKVDAITEARLAELDAANLPADVAAITSQVGTGARTVTITVNDGTTALEDARVRLTKGAESYVTSTNASGIATFYVDDGTWTVVVTLAGYTYAGTTIVVDGNETATYSMTQVVVPSSDPGQVTGFLYCYSESGVVESGAIVTVRQTAVAESTGVAYDGKARAETSNIAGLVEFTGLFKGGRYEVRRGGSRSYTVTIPDAANDPYELVSVIGLD